MTSPLNTIKEIIFGKFTGNAATMYGIVNEVTAKEQFEWQVKEKKNTRSTGLIVDVKIPFLVASPDAIIVDDSLVEIKCPTSAKELTAEEARTRIKIKS